MLKIVTDGAADMPDGWLEQYQIHMLPLRIRFGEETYTQGIDITNSNFYRVVEEKKIIPRTSLPSPQQVMEFYRSIAKRGEEILSIHLAGKMSGTFSTVQMAAQELIGELNVIPFDSNAGSAILGFMCREARLCDRAGVKVDQIIERLGKIRDSLTVIFTMDNLEFARMNGRVSALQSALTSMLKVKPIIVLRDGLLQMTEKVRTRSRSIDRVLDLVRQHLGDAPVNLAVVHANDPGTASIIVKKVKAVLNIKELILTELAIPVAANLGPGTIGIAAYPALEEN